MNDEQKTEPPKPGIHENISFEEYISWPCFHKSMVGSALRSTAHLEHYIQSERKKTHAMDLGSLADCLILEPHIFDKDFVCFPEWGEDAKGNEVPWNNRLKYCQNWKKEIQSQGLIAYSDDDFNNARNIYEGVASHPTAAKWLFESKKQVAIVWEDEETGILCKARLDALRSDRIVDLKTTVNASASEFARIAAKFLYHVQDFMYGQGYYIATGERLPFGFIVAESEAPNCVATYELGVESRLTGENLFRKAIRNYKDYLELGPTGYSNFEQEINIPAWAWMIDEEQTHVG